MHASTTTENGKQIDGYRILGVLGSGGMGVVYKAWDMALKRVVALKMIDPKLARDARFLKRFKEWEACSQAQVNSPHVVQIHRLSREDPIYIDLEYVDGGNLADLQTPLPWENALPIIKQALTGLDHAHSVGVIHRDIKPRNIMLTHSGQVKITDFGLAKMVDEATGETTVTEDQVAGTVPYMPPEQIRGLRYVDHRSDLFSLGMTCYELLAGRLPFPREASRFAIEKSITEQPFQRLDKARPEVPSGLARIVMKALEKKPEKRFQTAREMLAAIEAFEEEQAGPPPPPPSRWIWLVLVPLIALAGYAFYHYFVYPGYRPPSEPAGLSVITVPDSAFVYVEGDMIGLTPIREHPIEHEHAIFHVRKPGYVPVDTTLRLTAGQHLMLNLALVPLPPPVRYATVVVTSRPDGAGVWINGVKSGLTPHTDSLVTPGLVSVRIEKAGYTGRHWERDVRAGEEASFNADLVSLPADPDPPPARATLVLLADSEGTMLLDGRPVQAGQLDVDAGPHVVRCGAAPFHAETTITLAAAQTEEITCYFKNTISVSVLEGEVSNMRARVLIDGQDTGLPAGEFHLGPGEHRVAVQPDAYETVRVEHNGVATPGKEIVITLSPAFEKKTDRLIFHIRKLEGTPVE